MLTKWRKILIGLVCVAAVVALFAILGGGTQSFREKYEGVDLTSDVSGIARENTYEGYLAAHADAAPGPEATSTDIAAFEGDGELWHGDDGTTGVLTQDESSVTWHVNAPAAGMYNIALDYLTTASRGVDIEREVLINGEVSGRGSGRTKKEAEQMAACKALETMSE